MQRQPVQQYSLPRFRWKRDATAGLKHPFARGNVNVGDVNIWPIRRRMSGKRHGESLAHRDVAPFPHDQRCGRRRGNRQRHPQNEPMRFAQVPTTFGPDCAQAVHMSGIAIPSIARGAITLAMARTGIPGIDNRDLRSMQRRQSPHVIGYEIDGTACQWS